MDIGQDCGTVQPAHVISTSYSFNEADLTPFYTARQCAEYAKVCILLSLHLDIWDQIFFNVSSVLWASPYYTLQVTPVSAVVEVCVSSQTVLNHLMRKDSTPNSQVRYPASLSLFGRKANIVHRHVSVRDKRRRYTSGCRS
jgi:hypothetical protein